jgi:hypothetical protein
MKNLRTMMVALLVVLLVASMGFGSFTSIAQAVEVTLGEKVEMVLIPHDIACKLVQEISPDSPRPAGDVHVPLEMARKHRKYINKHLNLDNDKHLIIFLLLCHTT